MASDTYGAILLTTANDVGAMIQKKMATPSETYAPAVWAKTINLLGKLPEKSASGSIATFSDGADDVPTKSLVVTIPPTLSGVSSVTEKQNTGTGTPETQYTASLGRTIYGGQVDIVNGKCEPTNWLDDTLANLEQGSINGSTGANENANNRVRNASAIPFPYDEIVSSYTWTIPSGYKVAIRPYDANGNFVQLPSWALAFITQLPQDLIGQGITQMRFVLAKTDNSAITPSDMAEVGYILNKGNTAEAYSQYFAPFTFTGQEIPTRLGYNSFWSDEGDTEVTYRRDIDLALQSLSGSRGLMMARPPAAAETEETEPEDETTETIEEIPEDMEK